MYRVLKEKGHNTNVVVENTDTKANVIVGKLSMEILNVLEKAGHKIENYTEEMNIEVDADTAKTLSSMAMKMKKPIRDQSKKTKDTIKPKAGEVDAFDLIFGV